jgi:hypothetical protein
MARLLQDPSLLPAAVEELLRFTSPVNHANDRFTIEDGGWEVRVSRVGEQFSADSGRGISKHSVRVLGRRVIVVDDWKVTTRALADKSPHRSGGIPAR